jgi:uncharacterized protein (TIGR00297 family)
MDMAFSYLVAGVIGYLGYRARALTWDGAVAACLVGGSIFGFGGPGWAMLLVVFFVSSSLLSFVGRRDPRKNRASEAFEKGGRRDAWQVVANGGVAALAALLAGIARTALPDSDQQVIAVVSLFWMFVGVMSAATADTWATEMGVLSPASPRLITNWRRVQAGTSGGVTALGSGAALIGAALIWLAATWIVIAGPDPFAIRDHLIGIYYWELLPVALVGGLGGMLVDSLLGATVQAQYVCPVCNKPTESRVHRCGSATRLVGGVPWINNDVVNVAGTLVGGLLGLGVALI